MVNASLNWASIVGIALAICGGGLYFLRSFKPALARDYDVFFAAIGLLCGGILFFQGWRLDPILQFGQFLLAGTTVFFAYESVRLRGIATDQARRSSYFDEEYDSPPRSNSGFRSRNADQFDQFEEAQPLNRRFRSREGIDDYEDEDEDLYRARRSRTSARPAIPEEAASRRTRYQRDSAKKDDIDSRRMARFGNENRLNDVDMTQRSNFGDRRSMRQEERRGSRPRANEQTSRFNRNERKGQNQDFTRTELNKDRNSNRYSPPKGSPVSSKPEDAAFSSSSSSSTNSRRTNQSSVRKRGRSIGDSQSNQRSSQSRRPNAKNSNPRDNSSRFDD